MASASNYGVVALVTPPKLKLVDQPSLIRFETEYTVYKTKVEDVNKDRNDRNKVYLASIKDCVDPATLHALCVMGEIPNADKAEDATAETVKIWFDIASNLAPKDLSERIDSSLHSVSYIANPEDPAGGISNFVISVITALDQNNASEVFNDQDLARHFIDRMVKKMKDPLLQERIKMRRRGWSKTQLSNIKFFKNEAAAIAIDLALTETARQRVIPRAGRPRRGSIAPSKHVAKSRDAPKQVKSGRGIKRRESEWTDPCLNPNCGGVHPLKDCPNTSPERKKELFDEHYQNKGAKQSKAVKSLYPNDAQKPYGSQGRFRIALEDTVIDTVLGDSGSDFNAISSSTFEKVKEAKSSIKTEPFEKPIELHGAFKTDKVKFTASSKAKLTFTLYLPGTNVPVRVHGVYFIIVDDTMDEILLGRPFLEAIGFDLNDHLQRVHKLIHEKNIGDINTEKIKLAAAQYQGLAYMAADDDPIELPACIAAGIGEDSEDLITEAFDKVLSQSKSNGVSEEGFNRIKSMLKEYRDVFRIKLGTSPPADVSPLSITPAPNAKPYRSPQRRYAPQQREFIIKTINNLESIGAIYKNPSACWASPALAIPNPGSTKLRFTVDRRGPNSRTIPIQPAMPHLVSKFQDVSGSRCFGHMDLADGYWQVPLSPELQEMI